jgi:hypothetical protein
VVELDHARGRGTADQEAATARAGGVVGNRRQAQEQGAGDWRAFGEENPSSGPLRVVARDRAVDDLEVAALSLDPAAVARGVARDRAPEDLNGDVTDGESSAGPKRSDTVLPEIVLESIVKPPEGAKDSE